MNSIENKPEHFFIFCSSVKKNCFIWRLDLEKKSIEKVVPEIVKNDRGQKMYKLPFIEGTLYNVAINQSRAEQKFEKTVKQIINQTNGGQ